MSVRAAIAMLLSCAACDPLVVPDTPDASIADVERCPFACDDACTDCLPSGTCRTKQFPLHRDTFSAGEQWTHDLDGLVAQRTYRIDLVEGLDFVARDPTDDFTVAQAKLQWNSGDATVLEAAPPGTWPRWTTLRTNGTTDGSGTLPLHVEAQACDALAGRTLPCTLLPDSRATATLLDVSGLDEAPPCE